jgi:hypothetical protein
MRRNLVWILLGFLVSCTNGLGPAADVSGAWTTSRVEFSMTLNLVEHGTTVTGSGTSWAFIYPPTRQFSVAGSYSRPDLRLTFADDSGVIRGFTARVEDMRHMLGVETLPSGNTASDTLLFVRQ